MKIIGISAKAEHGKTFTCNVLKKEYEKRGYRVEIIPLAKALKDYARILGWDGQKDARGRSMLQELGPVLKHYHGGDVFARIAYETAVKHDLDVLLIDDMRLLDEVEFYENLLATHRVEDYRLYRVIRPNYENHLTEVQRNDLTETALDNYTFDGVLVNDGTDNFINVIKESIPL